MFGLAVDNWASTVATAHVPGSGQIVLTAANGLPALPVGRIYRMTAVTHPDQPNEMLIGVFEATGLTGSTLTGVTAAAGYADVNLAAGVTLQVRVCKATIDELQAIGPAQVQCSGDSITFGYGLNSPSTQAYPALTGAALGAGWVVTNQGRSGWGVGPVLDPPAGSLLAVDPGLIGPLWSWQRPVNIFSACGGGNDWVYGDNLANLKTNYTAWCQEMRALGYKVIAWTLMARSAGPTWEANRQTFNFWLRTNYLTFADDLCDVAAVPEMGNPGADTNLTYFQDGAHPTVAGHVKMEPPFTAAVRRVLAGTSPHYVAPVNDRPAYVTGTTVLASLFGGVMLGANVAELNGNFYYISDGIAQLLWMFDGSLTYYTAPSGTAGQTPVSFASALAVSAGGNLTVAGSIAMPNSFNWSIHGDANFGFSVVSGPASMIQTRMDYYAQAGIDRRAGMFDMLGQTWVAWADGSLNFQAAHNIVAGGTIASGTGATGSRPAATGAGAMFYDTTLHKPIWWDGAAWRDASGAVV